MQIANCGWWTGGRRSSAKWLISTSDSGKRRLAPIPNMQFTICNKKGSRAAVWHIYLNLVAKGVSRTPLQAIKFPKEKLAHRGDLLELPSNRLLAQIFGAITNIAGASHIILKGSRGVKEAARRVHRRNS
jgi:hypothetical protein